MPAYNHPSPGNDWTPWDTSLKGQWLRTGEWQKAQKDEIRHSCAIGRMEAIDHLLHKAAKEANTAEGVRGPVPQREDRHSS